MYQNLIHIQYVPDIEFNKKAINNGFSRWQKKVIVCLRSSIYYYLHFYKEECGV